MSKVSKACDISREVRKTVTDRDKGRCIVCGSANNLQVAHFVSRARLGLGIPENLALLCIRCHSSYDNGKEHIEIQNLFRTHLQEHYPEWDEKNLIYSKWRNFNVNT